MCFITAFSYVCVQVEARGHPLVVFLRSPEAIYLVFGVRVFPQLGAHQFDYTRLCATMLPLPSFKCE